MTLSSGDHHQAYIDLTLNSMGHKAFHVESLALKALHTVKLSLGHALVLCFCSPVVAFTGLHRCQVAALAGACAFGVIASTYPMLLHTLLCIGNTSCRRSPDTASSYGVVSWSLAKAPWYNLWAHLLIHLP